MSEPELLAIAGKPKSVREGQYYFDRGWRVSKPTGTLSWRRFGHPYDVTSLLEVSVVKGVVTKIYAWYLESD
jgi:hypothetical protein